MPVEHGQASQYAIEMRRHNAHHSEFGAPGRPYVFREFPKAMYRFKREAGKGIVKDEMQQAGDEDAQRNLESRGFHKSQELAIAAIEREHTEFARLAAEREWEIQHGRVSPKAAAEVRAAEEAHGSTHLPAIPETPIKRRGRKPKAPAVVESAPAVAEPVGA